MNRVAWYVKKDIIRMSVLCDDCSGNARRNCKVKKVKHWERFTETKTPCQSCSSVD